ncbi:Endolytic murein transglycosylase [Thauera humireducens]|uniref:endolytic transglycosylase MltG n=1 Tax=Thauera humireducens TaxID=1134435 RepID=UPI0024679FCE|nr:endolytic transglycosylase MltG [Thauera humireducens]CAH1748555.1 Endolytic murein transglycosylase [Thauera humireducens]
MKRLLLRIVLLLLALAVLAAGALYVLAHRPLQLKDEVVDFTVSRGQGMRQAANVIAAAGVDVNPALLSGLARISGRATSIKAGSYEVHRGVTPWQIVLKLSDGDVSQAEVLLVEGWTFAQVRRALESHPEIEPDTAGLSDAEILARIGAAESHPEGLFFPDTYLFDKRSQASGVLRRAYHAMQSRLAQAWAQRDPALPLQSPYQALILASIVEKETGRAEDRGLVASVFANRLRIGMPLQTDPTVIYGLGADFDGRLRRKHLDTDHPWNTYTRGGLPPTPIAMPGPGALRAAVKPQQSEYLYFVARGDGSSQFSRTLNEHNQAVNRYIRNGSKP